ncbi:MAG TPA: ABC transporter ATP-binding protein [Candidatus Tectomicrobia bacterium]|jgi:tungstate transport system ATP-binding protein
MAQALLTLQDILIQYGQLTALRLATLTVDTGAILAILGPNGAGKSTLLRVMGLLQRPTRGTVWFQAQPVTRANALLFRRRMASVLQEPLLLNATVYDNAALALKLRGLSRHTIEQRVGHWLERLGIAHLRQRSARSLSGGEAQRTSLVRALALEPDLLLLDEPFSALDPPSRAALILDLERILRDTGITTVFVTHDRHEALTLGDRVLVLFSGSVAQMGAPWEVFARPVTETVAHFVGADITLPGTVVGCGQSMAQVTTPVGTIEVPGALSPGAQVTLCLRPEDLTLHRTDQAPLPAQMCNLVTGTVAQITPWGTQMRVTLDCGVPLVALLTWRSLENLALAPGLPVLVTFATSAVHVICHCGNDSRPRPTVRHNGDHAYAPDYRPR